MIRPVRAEHFPREFLDSRQRLFHVGVVYLKDVRYQFLERCRVPVSFSNFRRNRWSGNRLFDGCQQGGKVPLACLCSLCQAFSAATAVVDSELLEDLPRLRALTDQLPNRCCAVDLN